MPNIPVNLNEMNQHQQIQEPQTPPLSPLFEATEEDELYNIKIDEMKKFLPSLAKWHKEATGFCY